MLKSHNLQVVQLSWLYFLLCFEPKTWCRDRPARRDDGEMMPSELCWTFRSRRYLGWAQHKGLSSQTSQDVAEKHL